MTNTIKTIFALITSTTILGGCAAIPGGQVASVDNNQRHVARIQGLQPQISYPLYAIGLSQEARIVGIDGQFNQSQFNTAVSAGEHMITVQTSCRFQMQEVRNEVVMKVNLQSGHQYHIQLDSDVSKGCEPVLIQAG
ncbi:MAG: hypothetical protein V3W04_14755 [Gammaproteobacteria bacterium]